MTTRDRSAPPVADVRAIPTYPRAFRRRVASAQAPPPIEPASEADLVGLPDAAVRYLRFMDVVGRPRARSLRAAMHGRFRRGPGAQWMPCRAWQYNTVIPLRRLFRMRLRVAPGLSMTGWDTYADGQGRMRGTLLGVFPVASGSGPQFTTSELVTWLNDAVLLAPSILLDAAVRFTGGTADGFGVEVTDGGRTVAAQVLLDDDGAPSDFWTDDRYADLPGGLVRARWHTPVDGWAIRNGRPRPTRASAVWQLSDGPLTYAEFAFDDVQTDPPPWRSSA